MRRNVNQHTLRGSLWRSDTLVQRETLLWNLKAHLHWRFQERFQVQFRGDFKSPCKLLYKSPRNRQYFYTGDLISLFNWGSIQLVELETGISKKNLWCGKVVLNCGSSPLFNHPHVSKIRRVKPNTHTLKKCDPDVSICGSLKVASAMKRISGHISATGPTSELNHLPVILTFLHVFEERFEIWTFTTIGWPW